MRASDGGSEVQQRVARAAALARLGFVENLAGDAKTIDPDRQPAIYGNLGEHGSDLIRGEAIA